MKNGGEDMIEITWRLCREVFEAEKVPRGWSKGLIFPLFKGVIGKLLTIIDLSIF